MPTITLYTDLCVSMPYNLYLASKSPYYVGENLTYNKEVIQDWVEYNFFFWAMNYKKGQEKKILKTLPFHLFNTALDQKKDILLSGRSADCANLKKSLDFVKQVAQTNNYTIKAIINLDRLDMHYEMCMRLIDKKYLSREFDSLFETAFLNPIATIPQIIKIYEEELGHENIQILWNHSSTPHSSQTIDANVIQAFSISDKMDPQEFPPHISNFKSSKARELWRIFAKIQNNYLGVAQKVAKALIQCEEKLAWNTSFTTSYKQRLIVHQTSIPLYEELEKRLGNKFQFDYKNAHIEKEYGANPLLEQDYLDFVSFLDKETTFTIQTAFVRYKKVLSKEQEELHHALTRNVVNDRLLVENGKANYKLSVLTLCYNHEKYIAECIESVQAQQTSFPIKHIIVDHASIDKSQEVIAHYAEKYDNITPYIFNVREGGGINLEALFKLADTEYVAICDGDDYFIDPLKLQKQVDVLDSNPSAAVCFHPVQVVYEGEPSRTRTYPPESMLPRGVRPFYYLSDMFQGNLIQTNSVVYRWRFKEGLPEWFRPDLVPGDWYWHLLHAENGKIAYINEIMSVYRRHKQSLYKEGEYEDSVKHRLVHGMNELECFDVVSKHFGKKFDSHIFKLASGVFANYVQYYAEHNDDSYLNNAVEKYPLFAKFFLSSLSEINAPSKQS